MTNREEMLNTISDLSKDAYGFRVRLDYAAMTDAELQSTWDRFLDDAEQSAREEAVANLRMQRIWETRIAGLMADHGISRTDALRWDMQAFDVMGDVGFYCYELGLAFELEPRIKSELTVTNGH